MQNPRKSQKLKKKTNLLDTSWTQHWSTLEVACAQLGRSFHWNRSTLTTQSIVTWWHCVCLWVLRVEQNLKQVPDTTKLLCLNVHVTGSGRHAQKQAGWSAVATLLPPPLTCTRTSCYMCYFMNAFDRFEQAATLSFELDGCGHLCEILWNKMQWHSKQDCLLAIQDVARAWDQTRDEILEIVQIQSPDRIDPHQLAISSDILSDIYSDSLFEFAFSCMFWHSRCPFVWHSIWHIIWHSLWQSLT